MPHGRPAADRKARDNGLEGAGAPPNGAADGPPAAPRESRLEHVILPVDARSFKEAPEYGRYGDGDEGRAIEPPGRGAHTVPPGERAPLDFLFAFESDPHDPDEVFARLRWGGQFVYASRHGRRVAE